METAPGQTAKDAYGASGGPDPAATEAELVPKDSAREEAAPAPNTMDPVPATQDMELDGRTPPPANDLEAPPVVPWWSRCWVPRLHPLLPHHPLHLPR